MFPENFDHSCLYVFRNPINWDVEHGIRRIFLVVHIREPFLIEAKLWIIFQLLVFIEVY